MKYTADQLHVINQIKAIGRQRYGNDPAKYHRYVKANLEIGAVESNFRNLPGGDADSAGYRQERASLYRNPTNLRAAINRAYDEMEQHDHGQAPWRLAADIQRPAAQYRTRYHDARQQASALLGGSAASSGAPGRYSLPAPGGMTAGTPPQLTPGGEATDQKAAMLAALLDHRKGMSLLDRFHEQVGSGRFTTTTPPTVTPGTPPSYALGTPTSGAGTLTNGGGKARLSAIEAEANRIDAAHVPYLWGGGHAGKQPRGSKVTPLDCSGAVSRVLGINPRVASQFMKWGKPGRGRDITIWAKPDHVIVEIAGHFWGTSQANPGGGAGWIPRSQITAQYLSQFTPRHPG